MGCDGVIVYCPPPFEVSIHAPTWGATSLRRQSYVAYTVSIHAPTWGATQPMLFQRHAIEFQSTHPHGVRRNQARIIESQIPVSIHAPTWGATYAACGSTLQNMRFNPRTHMGCDMVLYNLMISQKWFQSTHPHGVRLLRLKAKMSENLCFNPRTHMGCDIIRCISHKTFHLFQSTHPHGVRRCGLAAPRGSGVSIHAPTWGATSFGV
mgnify:CR=1 FL=1